MAPDRSFEIDCPHIAAVLGSATFAKGFVVIESDIELDVVAVYTTTPIGTVAATFHTERVPPRCVPVCEDLVLPLHTGLAGWETLSPTTGPVAQVNPLGAGWVPAPFGSAWVSEKSTDGSPGAPMATRTYQLCFDLCFGFTPPASFQIQGVAVGPASVNLNGNQVLNLPTPNTVATSNPITGPLIPGRNCFTVSVTNPGPTNLNPTGFALAGVLRVRGGKCPCRPLPMAP
ncbi:MAG TPA: hypothetical protein VF601_17475 [Beijerinckiaceae bacterium]